MAFSDRMNHLMKKLNERRAEINPSLKNKPKKEDRSKYITEGANVGVNRTAEIVKDTTKKTPKKITTEKVTVEAPAADLGNIGSVDRMNPEVIGPDMSRTNIPAPIEERSFNLPKDESSRFSTSNPMGMKRGGAVKSSASSRGDGIAQRGKTKGRMC
jgi:hypothetical protein